jgi:hypothetical protein
MDVFDGVVPHAQPERFTLHGYLLVCFKWHWRPAADGLTAAQRRDAFYASKRRADVQVD